MAIRRVVYFRLLYKSEASAADRIFFPRGEYIYINFSALSAVFPSEIAMTLCCTRRS